MNGAVLWLWYLLTWTGGGIVGTIDGKCFYYEPTMHAWLDRITWAVWFEGADY